MHQWIKICQLMGALNTLLHEWKIILYKEKVIKFNLKKKIYCKNTMLPLHLLQNLYSERV